MEGKSDKLLILDLDETLIHATKSPLAIPADFTLDAYFVYERPGLRQFLTAIAAHFAVGIWSSAGDAYVEEIVRQILPEGVELAVVWGRSKCSYRRDLELDVYCYEKRLDKLKKKGFSLDRILIVDDTPTKARTNYGNAIYIKEFTGDPTDRELQFLHDYLLTLKPVHSIRTVEKRNWRSD